MFIRKLSIENLKPFTSEIPFVLTELNVPDSIHEGSGLNVLVGENGCGKTTILEALALPLLSYKADGITINDFNDPKSDMLVTIHSQEPFTLSRTMPKQFFSSCGFLFKAKLRDRATKNYLSSIVVSDQLFIPAENEDSIKEGSVDLRVSVNNPFSGQRFSENEIIFLDKNRTNQTRTGTYNNTRFDRLMEDLNYQYLSKCENTPTDIDNTVSDAVKRTAKNDFLVEIINRASAIIGKDIRLHLLDNWKPYSNAFFSIKKTNNQFLNLNMLGSGYEMIFSLIFASSLSKQSSKQLIIMIDEPELHMHPKLQEQLCALLIELSKEAQIFISTHSPLLVKQLRLNQKVKFLILRNKENRIGISDMDSGVLPYISANEINYLAFDLPTAEFHDELYGHLMYKVEEFTIDSFDNRLTDQFSQRKGKRWQQEKNGMICGSMKDVTLQTFIRHKLHHPENLSMQSSLFSPEEMHTSIKEMIAIIKHLEGED
ncbi:MAG: AAA family ATPase [Tissierellales bacterium]|nr:AAA family ATPase [Tissierellales bacterium]